MRVLNLPFTCAFTALFATLSLAHPEPGVCRQSCSPKQIEYAFKSPRYMGETKRFCREYLGLKDVVKEISEEVKVVVTKVVEEKPK